MLLSVCYWVLVGLTIDVSAIPVVPGELRRLHRRAVGNSSVEPYSLPESDDEPTLRAQAIDQAPDVLYGPSPAGGRPFFPTG
jgi:hypothetical protein